MAHPSQKSKPKQTDQIPPVKEPRSTKRVVFVAVLCISFLILMFSPIILSSQNNLQGTGPSMDNKENSTPAAISLGTIPPHTTEDNIAKYRPEALLDTGSESTNPWRGAYWWYSDNEGIPDWPVVDSYERYYWRDIEISEGNYDFSDIDAQLAQAQKRSGKFGLRIMPAGVDNIAVPDYLVERMPRGAWFTNTYSKQRAYEPDWNDPDYMTRAIALIQALGKRYNNDPRLGWVDIFPYGAWGEWHTFGFPDNILPPMSLANQKRLVDANIEAFSKKRLVMFAENTEIFEYALSRSPHIGIRVDCLGAPNLSLPSPALDDVPLARDRWKTAPLIFEMCSNADFQLALEQIKTYHVAMASNGNFSPYDEYSKEQQEYLKQSFFTTGYRFVLNQIALPSSIATDTSFTVNTSWSNMNVTPAYNPWNVFLQLRKSDGTVAWQGKSSLDLEKLLPTSDQKTGTDTPVTITDTFSLPGTLAEGDYTVTLQIVDPDKYYQPLKLAIAGRNSDGSYTLGTITVKN